MRDQNKLETLGCSPENVWNEKSAVRPRVLDYSRPWYSYARELLSQAGAKPGQTALDVGCGVGEFLEELQEYGLKVTGLDGAPEQVKCLKEKGYDVEIADLERPLVLDDTSFDLVTCLEVVEHITQAERLLGELFRVLKAGGHMIISTPNFSCWQNRLRYLSGSTPVNEGVHLRFFTPYTFRKVITGAGFKIVGCASYAPYTGINYLRRIIGRNKKFWIASGLSESLFAEVLLYLARKS